MNLEVIDAQEKLTQARTNYFSALYAYNVSKAALEKAMGIPIDINVPEMSKEIEFKSTNHNAWKIFSIIGRLDTVTAPKADQATAAILKDNDKIAIDMTAMDYISSAGLRVLLRNAKRAKKNFVLFGASGMIKEVLEASDMDMLVKIYETAKDLP